MQKIIVMLPFLLMACTKGQPETQSQELSDAEIELKATQMVDSAIAAGESEALDGQAKKAQNQAGAPVEVLKAELVDVEYSNRRNISLKFKNNSDKVVTAIRFEWFGKDAFGDPADMGNPIRSGIGGGFTDDKLRPGKTDYATWDIYSQDAKTVTAARAYEVAFEDGTKWTAK